jgi:hypothetical protein
VGSAAELLELGRRAWVSGSFSSRSTSSEDYRPHTRGARWCDGQEGVILAPANAPRNRGRAWMDGAVRAGSMATRFHREGCGSSSRPGSGGDRPPARSAFALRASSSPTSASHGGRGLRWRFPGQWCARGRQRLVPSAVTTGRQRGGVAHLGWPPNGRIVFVDGNANSGRASPVHQNDSIRRVLTAERARRKPHG